MPRHKALVADTFLVPESLSTDRFFLRPLLYTDAELDFEAWTSSIDDLRGVFGPHSKWPYADMSLQDNVIDCAWHQREHETRASFAFTVLDPAQQRCLGCVDFSPPRKVGFDVEVFTWVRSSELSTDGDEALLQVTRTWLADKWPFTKPVYPGRDISWDDYLALPDQFHW